MEIPNFSKWGKFSEWKQTIERTPEGVYKNNGFNNYTPWNALWGYREEHEGLCIDQDLVEILFLHKIPKDGLNEPVLLNGLWSNDKKFFLRFRGETKTGDLSYFLAEVSLKEWMKTIEWFYSRSWNIRKSAIKRKIHEQMDHYIGIILKEA